MTQEALFKQPYCFVFDPLPEGWVAPVTIIPAGYWQILLDKQEGAGVVYGYE